MLTVETMRLMEDIVCIVPTPAKSVNEEGGGNPVMRWLRKLVREVEVGHARNAYNELLLQGVISMGEYMEYMRYLDDQLRKIKEEEQR